MGEQLTLEPARPRTRHADPATSHRAAATVVRTSALKQLILDALAARPMTDEELIDELTLAGVHASPSGVRSRRAELVDEGRVHETGRTRSTRMGRDATVWASR